MTSEEIMDKQTLETEKCGGCRSCELACSYHHRGVFQPSVSSIEITKHPKIFSFDVNLYWRNIDDHIGCDACKGLDVPLCVRVCSRGFSDELKNYVRR